MIFADETDGVRRHHMSYFPDGFGCMCDVHTQLHSECAATPDRRMQVDIRRPLNTSASTRQRKDNVDA